eukprot:2514344-Rhodomonas_salina.2
MTNAAGGADAAFCERVQDVVVRGRRGAGGWPSQRSHLPPRAPRGARQARRMTRGEIKGNKRLSPYPLYQERACSGLNSRDGGGGGPTHGTAIVAQFAGGMRRRFNPKS